MKNILIAYSTWSGTTREVSERIKKNIEKEFDIDIFPAKNVKTIEAYDALVLGTSIHAGHVNKDFQKFLRSFIHDLKEKPISIFVVCANMIEDNEKTRSETKEWLQKTLMKYPEFKPILFGFFSGAVLTETPEFQKSNFFVKKIILAMKSKMQEDYGKSDFRDWEKIDKWSSELVNKIGN